MNLIDWLKIKRHQYEIKKISTENAQRGKVSSGHETDGGRDRMFREAKQGMQGFNDYWKSKRRTPPRP